MCSFWYVHILAFALFGMCFFGLCSFWHVLFSVRPLFGMCSLWHVLFFVCAHFGMCLFGMCSFWNVLILACAHFGMCSLWHVLFFVCAHFGMCLFGMCSFWHVLILACALFGMCSFWHMPHIRGNTVAGLWPLIFYNSLGVNPKWFNSSCIQLKLMYWWEAYFLLQVALWKPQRNFHEGSSTKGRASLYDLDRIRHTTLVNIWGYAKHALCTLGWKLSNTSEIVRRFTVSLFWKNLTAASEQEGTSALILVSIFCIKNRTSCVKEKLVYVLHKGRPVLRFDSIAFEWPYVGMG